MAFVKARTERKENNLYGTEKALAERIGLDKIDAIKELRDGYKLAYNNLRDKQRAILDNKRLKNKTMTFGELADIERSWFNYRSLDYFLYRLGEGHTYSGTAYEGIEEELAALESHTHSMLHVYGDYRGYQATYWWFGGGSNHWLEDGAPEDYATREKYWREDLGTWIY